MPDLPPHTRQAVYAQTAGTAVAEIPPMPPHIRARVERRLDRIARELLAEELERDTPVVPGRRGRGRDRDGLDGVGDQPTPLREPPRRR